MRFIPVLTAAATSMLCGALHARNLENEKPLAEIRSEDGINSLRVALSLQARMEYGDLAFGDPAVVKGSEFDLYFRRVGIGVYGSAFVPGLKYGITLTADESSQANIFPSYRNEGVTLGGTYLQYFYLPKHFVKFGKDKLPLSRAYVTSSTQQLFAERPYYTYGWRDVLPAYAITNVSAGGQLLGDTVRYEAAVAKGWRPGDHVHDDPALTVQRARPFVAARLEFAPPGWTESARSDAHLGRGRHLSVGVYGARQSNLAFLADGAGQGEQREQRQLYGADLSFHNGSLTLQAESNAFKTSSPLAAFRRKAEGRYAQVGYLFTSAMLEPALRYEVFDTNTALPDAAIRSVTVGLNKYLQGHNLKVNLNWTRNLFDDHADLLRPQGKSAGQVVRATVQFIF